MTIYVDSDFRCHTTDPDGNFRKIEHEFFNSKCATFIEGYCYDDSKGYEEIYPWKPSKELTAAQAQYEKDLAEAAAAYQEGVNAAYDQQ